MYFGLPQLSQGRIWHESGNLSEIIPAQGPATDQAHLARRSSSSDMTEHSLSQNRRHKHRQLIAQLYVIDVWIYALIIFIQATKKYR